MALGHIAHFTECFLQLVNAAFVLAVLHEVHERLHEFDFIFHEAAGLAAFFELLGKLDQFNGIIGFQFKFM